MKVKWQSVHTHTTPQTTHTEYTVYKATMDRSQNTGRVCYEQRTGSKHQQARNNTKKAKDLKKKKKIELPPKLKDESRPFLESPIGSIQAFN